MAFLKSTGLVLREDILRKIDFFYSKSSLFLLLHSFIYLNSFSVDY